jgi:hypothetical protein
MGQHLSAPFGRVGPAGIGEIIQNGVVTAVNSVIAVRSQAEAGSGILGVPPLVEELQRRQSRHSTLSHELIQYSRQGEAHQNTSSVTTSERRGSLVTGWAAYKGEPYPPAHSMVTPHSIKSICHDWRLFPTGRFAVFCMVHILIGAKIHRTNRRSGSHTRSPRLLVVSFVILLA